MPVQGTRVQSLVWEDSTCHWKQLKAWAPQLLSPRSRAHALEPTSCNCCSLHGPQPMLCNKSGRQKFSSVAQSCPTLCDPMNRSTPGLPVQHQLPEPTQTHVQCVGDAIQPSHPLLPSSSAFNLSQHQRLFQWISSFHQVGSIDASASVLPMNIQG